jgi:nitroreductase
MVLGAGCWVLGAGCWVPGVGCRVVSSLIFKIFMPNKSSKFLNKFVSESLYSIKISSAMKKYVVNLFTILLLNGIFVPLIAQDIVLPAPDKTGGKPLMQALNERHTTRTFTADSLTLQQLSDLLWAGFGINRPDQGKRTAPSAMNWQEIDIYVTLPGGSYLYQAESHSLKFINNKDLRKATGGQSFVADAALNILYIADLGKREMKEGDPIKDSDLFMSYADAAFIAQNIYLYCASANLGCVVRASVPDGSLASDLGLRTNQKIVLAQTVGVPAK